MGCDIEGLCRSALNVCNQGCLRTLLCLHLQPFSFCA
jgi:hypothetical protein